VEYAKQLLYTQMVKEKIGDVVAGARSIAEAVDRIAAQEDAFFPSGFISAAAAAGDRLGRSRSCCSSTEGGQVRPEFEAFLLEVLSDFQVSIPSSARARPATSPSCS